MKSFYLLLLLSILSSAVLAQSNIPQVVSFSAVVRDANNQPLVNTPVSIRLTFKKGGATGPLVYCALHQDVSNANGFISLQLNRNVLGTGCNGAPSTTFENIPWKEGGFWMEVEYQTVPNTPFTSLGQLELASSFYAFAAGSAEEIKGVNLQGAQNGYVLAYNQSTGKWEPTPATAGPQGPVGPIGPQGPAGQNGAAGATGPAGPGFANGTTSNQIMYWNGTAWTTLNPGGIGQVLTLCNGGLTWTTGGICPASLATLTTTAVSSITSTTASSGGNISNDGGGAVTARGVVWSTSQNPTIALTTKTTDGTGTGSFTSNLTGLSPGTVYYVRAYATNSAGTAYGNQLSFTSAAVVLATLTTTTTSSITSTTVSSGGNISNDGGGAVTARGVVWSTSQNPTIALTTKTNNGTGTGIFTSNITGLSPSTVYYIRAYATNSAGTAYGNQQTLTTATSSNPVDVDGNVYTTVTIGSQVWMKENLKTSKYRNGDAIPTNPTNIGWQNTTSGAYAIYNNDAANNTTYGKLYNWYAVADPRGLCPAGWHVPTDHDWQLLTKYLDPAADTTGCCASIAGGKMKSTGTIDGGTGLWYSPNQDATNSSGFTGLPGGRRANNGTYNEIGYFGFWWSSTEYSSANAWYRYLDFYNGYSFRYYDYNKTSGFSVRCLRD
jgi:uncharacterized protein (TIGR02145 family)